MSAVKGVIEITDDPVVVGDEAYQIDLTYLDNVSYIQPGKIVVSTILLNIREKSIRRVGKNYLPKLEEVTSRPRLVKKQVEAIQRLHGDVNGNRFRFNADRA